MLGFLNKPVDVRPARQQQDLAAVLCGCLLKGFCKWLDSAAHLHVYTGSRRSRLLASLQGFSLPMLVLAATHQHLPADDAILRGFPAQSKPNTA